MRSIAIIDGHKGRLGAAFFERLLADGYEIVTTDNLYHEDWPQIDARYFMFDFAYRDQQEEQHIARAAFHMAAWRKFAGIFIPSSYWISTDTSYGRAKLVIEQLARFYNGLGANIVTDRIGYFPGDGIEPDPTDRFFDKLVTGDEIYERVMKALVK